MERISPHYSRSADPKRWPDWQLEGAMREEARKARQGQEAEERLGRLVEELSRRTQPETAIAAKAAAESWAAQVLRAR